MSNVLLLDIEASELFADDAIVFCICCKWLGKKEIKTFTLRSDPDAFNKVDLDDTDVIEDFRPILESADLVVHHYGDKYDMPFLQGRCVQLGRKTLASPPTVDTWRICRYKLKFRSNRLQHLSQIIGTKEKKTPLTKKVWNRAYRGHIPSLKQIEHHCRQDILVLEELYKAVAPHHTSHPNLAALKEPWVREACRTCQSTKTGRMGVLVTRQGKRQRWRCNNCGHGWSAALTAQ